LYKRFWTCLLHRGVWDNPIYIDRKKSALQCENNQDIVFSGPRGGYHRRDLMPQCVLTLVRSWLPNPKSKPYMGHKWN
jgi:hypothetical protein